MTAGSLVRIVVVTYSPGPSLQTFLSSLQLATSSAYEVVLADNGSTDGAPEAAAAVDKAHKGARNGGMSMNTLSPSK